MKLEEKLKKLEDRIHQFKSTNDDSLVGKIIKAGHLVYIVDVGGSLLPRYQRRHAQQLGWLEKDLTMANAVFCGILPSLFYFAGNYFFGDDLAGKSFQDIFYSYPSFMFTQSVGRTFLAQSMKKSIPSISPFGIFGSLGYAVVDLYKEKYKEKACEES